MVITMATLKEYIAPRVRTMSYELQLLQDVSNSGHNVYPPTDPDEGDPADGAAKWFKNGSVWED